MKIIDAHMHVVHHVCGFGAQGELTAIGNGKAMYASGAVIDIIPPQLGQDTVTPEKVIALMDRENVERGVLLQGMYLGFQNLYVAQAVRRFPDRLVGAATYDPFCQGKDAIRSHLFDQLGFSIEKFEVAALMSYHGRVPLDGDVMTEAFDYCDEHRHLCVMDLGNPHAVSCQIEAMRAQILRHPGMNFVICHILAPRKGDKELMCAGLERLKLPNVWFDYASLFSATRPGDYPFPTAQQYLLCAKQIVGADRLMFGSDLPSTLTRTSYANLRDYPLEGGVFSPEEAQLVFYGNAKQVYFGGK